jgi:hypothetical protein
VVDDQVRAKLEMRGPAPVHSREQPVAVRVEHQPEARAPPVFSLGAALVDVFPAGPAVMGRARHEPRNISASELHEPDRVELLWSPRGMSCLP